MKATIDLNWLDDKINDIQEEIDKGKVIDCEKMASQLLVSNLKIIRSKCEPIEEPTINGYKVTTGEWKVTPYIESPIPYTDGNTGKVGVISAGRLSYKPKEPLFKLAEQDPNEGIFFPDNAKFTITTKDTELRKENAYNTGFIGMPTRKPEPAIFLSKTCVNNWESNKYCESIGKCELCKTK
jgi:hypothetical protein